jgi:hypothetical protein
MVKRRTAYTLRYGESQQNDMLVYFDDDETLIENLRKIIPSAIQRGFLPKECSADTVKLIHKDRALNLNVTMNEQEARVAEREVLVIHDLSSTVRIKIKYTPDNHAERMDTVHVNPNRILGDELSKYLAGVAGDYKFYRRKAKKFKLVGEEGRKVNLNKSLVAQGIESGFDASLRPRLIFRWPPSRVATGTAAGVLLVLLVLAIWAIYVNYLRRPPVIDMFYVTFTVDAEAQLAAPDTSVALTPGTGVTLALPPGTHELEVIPRDYPIFHRTYSLTSEGAVSDSVSIPITIVSRFEKTPKILVVITGYQGGETPDYRIKRGLFINRVERQLDPFGTLRIELCKELYEIKYDLPDDVLNDEGMRFDPRVRRPSRFRFDFRDVEETNTYLTFHYSSSK